jgi:hypothetical protein
MQLFYILPVCMICTVQIFVEQAAIRFAACVTDIRRFSLDLARIVHKVRTSLIARIALSAWYPALSTALLSAYVSLPAALSILASVLVELLLYLYRLMVTMLADLLGYGIRTAPYDQCDLCKCPALSQPTLDLVSVFPGKMFSFTSLSSRHASSSPQEDTLPLSHILQD